MSSLKINDILKFSKFYQIFDPIMIILIRPLSQIQLMLPEPYFAILKYYRHTKRCWSCTGCIPHSLWALSQNFTSYCTNRRGAKLDADLLACVLLLYLKILHALGVITPLSEDISCSRSYLEGAVKCQPTYCSRDS